MDARFDLPPDLPVPTDDGACDHLRGLRLPPIALPATDGPPVDLSRLTNAVVFCYPRTGLPQFPAGDGWDAIPGARGCTPQSCAFRDLHGEFVALGVRVLALSTQTTAYQQEFAQREHIPFPILSDADLRLTNALRLPTFEFDVGPLGGGGPGTLLRRMAWHVRGGVIERVWYPVFPPNRNAQEVLGALRGA